MHNEIIFPPENYLFEFLCKALKDCAVRDFPHTGGQSPKIFNCFSAVNLLITGNLD